MGTLMQDPRDAVRRLLKNPGHCCCSCDSRPRHWWQHGDLQHRRRLGAKAIPRSDEVGIGVGLLISLVSVRVLSIELFEISPADPLTFVGVSVMLASVALLACYIPARRAAKVDPMVALRCETELA
jgi:hypothetical protein